MRFFGTETDKKNLQNPEQMYKKKYNLLRNKQNKKKYQQNPRKNYLKKKNT